MKCVTLILRTFSAFGMVIFVATGLIFDPVDILIGLVGGGVLLALAEWLDSWRAVVARREPDATRWFENT